MSTPKDDRHALSNILIKLSEGDEIQADTGKGEQKQRIAKELIQALRRPHITERTVEPATASPNLSSVVEEYCQEEVRESSWSSKTEHENRAAYGLLIRIAGDLPIRTYLVIPRSRDLGDFCSWQRAIQ